MTFTIANWGSTSTSLNAGQETVTPFGGSPTVENTCNVFTYISPTDAVATITASNYFLAQYASLSVGDIIWGSGTDASFAVQVTAVSSTTVTVASMGLTTSIGTADIIDHAVTYVKIQQASAHTLLGNPTSGTANVEEITLGNGLEFTGTTLDLPNTSLVYAAVPLTAAQFKGMYDTPVQLVAAPGANKLISVDKIDLLMTFVSADYANGGVVAAQYDSTAHGAGVLASTTWAAASFFVGASTGFLFGASSSVGQTFSTCVNKGLYLSNLTGDFITGDSTFVAHVWYRIIPTV